MENPNEHFGQPNFLFCLTAFLCLCMFFSFLWLNLFFGKGRQRNVGWAGREICFGEGRPHRALLHDRNLLLNEILGGQGWVKKQKNWTNSKLLSHCFYIEAVEPFNSSFCPQSFPRESYIYLCFAPIGSMNMNIEQGTMVFLVYSPDLVKPSKIFKL